MAISNEIISESFSLLAKLMEIHGENSFRARSYSSAAFAIDKLPTPLADLPAEKMASIRGIGEAIGKKVQEILSTGRLKALDEILESTPPGILEMLQVKGLGPKKIAIIWKEMGIESLGELLYACQENRLLLYKGFGEKTQQSIAQAIEFIQAHAGSFLYAQLETFALDLDRLLAQSLPQFFFQAAGAFVRQMEVIEELEWVSDGEASALQTVLEPLGYRLLETSDQAIRFEADEKIQLCFYPVTREQSLETIFEKNASPAFLEACGDWRKAARQATGELQIFQALGLPFLPAFLREEPRILEESRKGRLPEWIQPAQVRALVHCHTNWSDGANSLEEMAHACRQAGMEWMVISDHSKSAFYANGLSEERIIEQHRLVEELNAKLHPFRIFKSIECDILSDGTLDYGDDILARFDLVIASIHSNLKMTQEKAMARLLAAIAHPRVTILGHPTGRLLLSRPGYPVDHEAIIRACATHRVVLELNAHPRRLDLDWRWISRAVDQGVLISIDPDAHSISGIQDIRYGVLVAQKAGLSAQQNLSSFTLQQMEGFLEGQRGKAAIGR